MTNYIQVSAHATGDPKRFHVAFATQTHAGILPVEIEHQTEDLCIVAELVALRYLLALPAIGAPGERAERLDITVSKGAIKKLIQGRSNKKHLVGCSRWLKQRYLDAYIRVSHRQVPSYSSLVEASAGGEPTTQGLTVKILEKLVTGDDVNQDIVLNNPIVGDCTITMHAIERYMERSGITSWRRAWENVADLVQCSNAKDVALPKSIERRKRMKYREPETIVSVQGGWHLVFTPDRNNRNRVVLCTVYRQSISGHITLAA